MRTIRLYEHQTTQIQLTPTELEQLLRTRAVAVTPRLDGEYDVRPGSIVGTMVARDVRVLIRPKIGIRNLLFLLSYAAGITKWRDERFPYGDDEDLFDAMARLFEAEIRQAAPGGLIRNYEDREETLATLRGRLDIQAQLRRREGRRFPLECRFQEYTEDNRLNRILKAAHRRLLQIPRLDRRVVRNLRQHQRLFSDVATLDYPPKGVPEVALTRLTSAWEPALRLARLILQSDSVRDVTGTVTALSFTVDMNRVYERFVEAVVVGEAKAHGYAVEPQAKRTLSASILMRPDLVVKATGRDVAVADAKYKETAIEEWPHADLYQLLAYCTALRLPRGLLMYAGERTLQREVVIGSGGITLEAIGINLEGDHRAVLGSVRAAARRLIDHADAVTQGADAVAA